ncbi:MAG: hypothetical protein JWR54_400 [Mucilaginibacter sp.]|nr:hypothetical protein [Mucilaginibacter sp.]
MGNSFYHLIINTFCVGTWLQTLMFYFVLFLFTHIILVQMKVSLIKVQIKVSFIKWRINFFQRWMED